MELFPGSRIVCEASPKTTQRKGLLALAGRLSSLVREAVLKTGRWEAPEELKRKIAELKGKRLESKALIELVIGAIQALPSGTGDCLLVADRL